MPNTRPVISHVVISCFDYARMIEYYTKTLGFYLSDIGQIRDTQLCFLTLDPAAEHHQVALTGGRKGRPGEGALVHVCFRLDSYPLLQARHRDLLAKDAAGLKTVTHGSWLSVYSDDPESNTIEFRWDLPWYVGQPFAQPVDLSLSEAEIRDATIAQNRDNPRFQPMAEWRAKAIEKLGAE